MFGTARQRLQAQRTGAREQIKDRDSVEVQARLQHAEQRLPYPIRRGPGSLRRHRDPASARGTGDDPGQLITTSRSPPST
ncbi:hypothetical protein NJBCHELONAE_50290 [Mycobacteroides chelonae]|nr:hypothetical protein NJBCHELONAE_50290 [Mycobacteroides chelonae]